LSEQKIDMSLPEALQSLALALDRILNGEQNVSGELKAERKNGFVLMLFPFDDKSGKCNYITNGASREDVKRMFETQIEALEASKQ